MKVLVLGGEGMLGHKVFEILSRRFETYATFADRNGPWRSFPTYSGYPSDRLIGGVNAFDIPGMGRVVEDIDPFVVINCIGIIKQLREAADPVISITLNSLFPHQLAEICAGTGARMFHMSTDCVFTGNRGMYTEDDRSDAEDLYGRTKLLGEVDRPGCLTIRTSIIGRDFLKDSAMLEWFLSNRGGRVRGYRNSIYTGFPTQVLAGMMGDIISDHPHLSGLYQIASEPITKYDLLLKIRDAMKLDITIEPFDDPPCNRSLSPRRFIEATGYRIPSWDDMIDELASDPTPYDEWRSAYAAARK
jgi:dTDP-4-dehydrorhamnose reductase